MKKIWFALTVLLVIILTSLLPRVLCLSLWINVPLALIALIIIVGLYVVIFREKAHIKEEKNSCPQCGKIIGIDKKFCTECGTEVKKGR